MPGSVSSRSTSAGRQKSGAPAEGIAGCAPELRNLTRTRKQLVREIAQHTLRIQKVLEDANVKLTGVVSDVLRASGRAILTALVAGEADPERLVALTTGRLKAPCYPGRRPARPYHSPPSLPAPAPPDADRRARSRGARRGAARGRCPRSLSHRRRPPDRDARHRPHRRPRAPRRDPHRYEPVPDRRPPALLGGTVPPPA